MVKSAFPVPAPMIDKDGNEWWSEQGMSLRDYFAGQALAGYRTATTDLTISEISSDCYRLADAMLKERDNA